METAGTTQEAIRLTRDFAERTGVTSDSPSRRYLWTDAFAVCNLLGLFRRTDQQRWVELALELIDRVHRTLGRHRPDDPRTGWLSGLQGSAAEEHPTLGGLRIGKGLPERRAGEPFDERLEWDRDGQYFHYLTQWMHALDQTARLTRQRRFNVWARELAALAFAAFSVSAGRARRRMVWKMSVDLSRPLVPSMGQHDPLAGVVACAQLRATAGLLGSAGEGPDLAQELGGFASMIEPAALRTADPLGMGGLLIDACRLAQVPDAGPVQRDHLIHLLLASALAGLRIYERQGELEEPARRRLAFRELGLAIGLHAVALVGSRMEERGGGDETLPELVAELRRHVALGTRIEEFWLDSAHQEREGWSAHRDINETMLASCLVPEGCLVLGAGDS
jgi:hypothetical protein